jgi:hypothetical protein
MEPQPKKPAADSAKGSLWPWFVAFFVIEAIIAYGVLYSRTVLLESYKTEQAQTDWDKWKSDAKKMGEENTGLVSRREPKATQPPGLILMRDYFPQILIGSVALSAVLVGMTMLMVYGVVNQRPTIPRED